MALISISLFIFKGANLKMSHNESTNVYVKLGEYSLNIYKYIYCLP